MWFAAKEIVHYLNLNVKQRYYSDCIAYNFQFQSLCILAFVHVQI